MASGITGEVPAGVHNVMAWERFLTLAHRGAGVIDHPAHSAANVSPSPAFLEHEIRRVSHHLHNTIPFLVEHCGIRDAAVVEIGAGTGGLAVAMVLAGARSVDAVEPVPLNREAGEWRARAHELEARIRFHGPTESGALNFANESFDVAVCSSVLQYVPGASERADILAEMMRVTKTGGVLAYCATANGLYPGGPHATRWWSNLFPRVAAIRGHDRGVTFWELKRILAAKGCTTLPQGKAAYERWIRRRQGRMGQAGRGGGLFGGAVRLLHSVAGPATGAPLEAFLPFPDLAFRKGTSAKESSLQ